MQSEMIGVAIDNVEKKQNDSDIKPHYLEALTLIERLHRRLLDVIKDEFDRAGEPDAGHLSQRERRLHHDADQRRL